MTPPTAASGPPVAFAPDSEEVDPQSWGLALSGGGSRAAAFHRGTLRALRERKLLDQVSTVSTVSGGSVFGAGWLAQRAAGKTDEEFLAWMADQLRAGFVGRALWSAGLGLLRLLLPSYTRTHLLADFFQKEIAGGRSLADLPEHPKLVMNTTVLNTGQVGKFTREGFWTEGLRRPEPGTPPLSAKLPVGFAVAASAAFPIGLPPLGLPLRDWFSKAERAQLPPKLDAYDLTDGGVLENFGFQTLIKGQRFATWNLVVSDAEVRRPLWRAEPVVDGLKAVGAAVLSLSDLVQTLQLMNDKESRSGREVLFDNVERSMLQAALANPALQNLPEPWRRALGVSVRPRRKLLTIRVNQTFDNVLDRVPTWRLVELLVLKGAPTTHIVPTPGMKQHRELVMGLLQDLGIDLGEARKRYADDKGDDRAGRCNQVHTQFTALKPEEIRDLEAHAAWQVGVMDQIYGG